MVACITEKRATFFVYRWMNGSYPAFRWYQFIDSLCSITQFKTKLAGFNKIATVRSTGSFDLAPILRNERTGISVLNARPLLNNVSVLDIKYLASQLGQSNVVLVSHERPSFNLQWYTSTSSRKCKAFLPLNLQKNAKSCKSLTILPKICTLEARIWRGCGRTKDKTRLLESEKKALAVRD